MRKLLILITSLIPLSCIVIIIFGFYVINIDPNNHKDWIAEQFFEQTGRSLTIDGDIAITHYPWFGLELNQVTVGNLPDFSETPLLYTEHALVRVKLMPALKRQYEIDTVLLQGSRVNLEVNELGQNNWSGLSAQNNNDAGENSTSDSISLSNIILGGVDIQAASLIFDDRANDQHIELSNLTMTTGELVYGQPVQLNIDLDISSTRPALAAKLALTGTIVYSLDQSQYTLEPLSITGSLSGPNIPNGSTALALSSEVHLDLLENILTLNNLEVDVLDTHLSANVIGQNIQTQNPAVSASINLDGQDLGLLFRVAAVNADMAELADKIQTIDDRQFDFSAALTADTQTGDLTLTGLEANLLGASINGNLSTSNLGTDAAKLSGQLNASGPDLPTLLEVAGQIQSTNSALSQYAQQLSVMADKRFTINADFDADFQTGTIQVPVLNANLLGFSLSGELTSNNMTDSNGSVTGNLNLENNDLAELMAALDQNDLAEVVQSINLSLGINGNRNNLTLSPLNLNLVLDSSQIPNSPVDLNLQARSNINLNADSLNMDEFSINGLGLNASGQLQAQSISNNPQFTGNINIQAFNLRQLLSQLNQDIPATADPSTLQRVSIGTSFKGTGYTGTNTNLELSNFSVVLDESTLTGNLSITDFENPSLDFSINVDQINWDRYLSPETNRSDTSSSQTNDLPIDTLQALNISGEFAIQQLQISDLDVSNFQMTLYANNGQINLSPIQAQLYQGNYDGALMLDVQGNTPLLSFESSLQSIAIEPLMQDFMQASSVSGIGDINFLLSSSGSNITALKRNLNGTGNIALRDGIFQGVDVGATLAQVEVMIQRRRLQSIQRGEATAFNNFTASLNIDNGDVSSNDLIIEAPGFQVTGRGTLINLIDDSINYQLMTTVDSSTATRNSEEYDIGGYSLPIICTGNINSPSCRPDVEDIIASALRQAVGRGLNSILQRALDIEEPTAPSSNEAENTQEAQPEPESIEDQLINRALESLFR